MKKIQKKNSFIGTSVAPRYLVLRKIKAPESTKKNLQRLFNQAFGVWSICQSARPQTNHHFKRTILFPFFLCSTQKIDISQKGSSPKSKHVCCFISCYSHSCLSIREVSAIRTNMNSVQYEHDL